MPAEVRLWLVGRDHHSLRVVTSLGVSLALLWLTFLGSSESLGFLVQCFWLGLALFPPVVGVLAVRLASGHRPELDRWAWVAGACASAVLVPMARTGGLDLGWLALVSTVAAAGLVWSTALARRGRPYIWTVRTLPLLACVAFAVRLVVV